VVWRSRDAPTASAASTRTANASGEQLERGEQVGEHEDDQEHGEDGRGGERGEQVGEHEDAPRPTRSLSHPPSFGDAATAAITEGEVSEDVELPKVH
jgi:hypothetical protein